jgi:universal protein Kae1
MIVLGVEGTAHTLGVGITDSGNRVLADVRRVYSPSSGGIHPRDASQFMSENVGDAIKEALAVAAISIRDVNLISFSQGPGMGPCLRTVATAARALSLHNNIPLLGVNHCVAHIEVGRVFCNLKDPLILYVSGGNTQVLKLKDNYFRIFGETLDIGVGNMLDKFGREAGIGHPAGPKIEALAKDGGKYIELPYAVKGTDLSFSGLLTSALGKTAENRLEDVCFSLQETAFAMLTEVTERALAHLKAKEVLLTGGVGNNRRLAEMLSIMSEEQGASFGVPAGYCSDNGVMIALLGRLMYASGIRQEIADTGVRQRFRTDAVEVKW